MLVITTPADDLALVPIEALRVAAGLADDDTSRDAELTPLGLRIAGEITDACGIIAGRGGEPTLRRERLTETISSSGLDTLVLSRRHDVEIVSITDNGDTITLDDRALDVEAGLVERWIDGNRSCWRSKAIIIVYDAGFDLEDMPAALVGAVTDLVRIRLAQQTSNPLASRERVRVEGIDETDTFFSTAVPGALPDDILGRLGRFIVPAFV